MNDALISLDQVALIPRVLSSVNSRKELNPFYEDGKLPLFVAPMTCIVDKNNYNLFNSKTHAILPVRFNEAMVPPENSNDVWLSYSFDEFKKMCEGSVPVLSENICVDMANGHMESLYKYVKLFKDKNFNAKIMVGNIANAEAYYTCWESGVDYVRVGIGGGNGCITSVRTGFHNSIVNVLNEIKVIKGKIAGSLPKVVADGGIDSIGKAIKCLALGADYVMMGRLFAQCKESTGKTFHVNSADDLRQQTNNPFINIHKELKEDLNIIKNNEWFGKEILVKEYYGQASEKGQIDRFGEVKSAPEGVTVYLPCTHTYNEFVSEFESYLRSAMSYNGSFILHSFIGNVEYREQSLSEFNSYNK